MTLKIFNGVLVYLGLIYYIGQLGLSDNTVLELEWRAKIHENLTPLKFPKIIKSHSRGWSKYSVNTTPSISSLEKRDFLHLTRLVHQKTDYEVLCCFCCFCSLWIYSMIHILHCDFWMSKSNTRGTIGLPIHLKQASIL